MSHASTLPPPRLLPARLPQATCSLPASALRACPPACSRTLTPAQFGARFGLSAATIYRYIQTGWIDEHFVTLAGPRKIQIDESAVAWFREECRRRRAE